MDDYSLLGDIPVSSICQLGDFTEIGLWGIARRRNLFLDIIRNYMVRKEKGRLTFHQVRSLNKTRLVTRAVIACCYEKKILPF